MKIPFFPNIGDGTHCFQAALKMALAYFMPERSFDYDELDRISGKKLGMWTWPTRTILWLMDNGIDVQLIEKFDYKKFAKRGFDYLVDRYGEEIATAQRKNSNLISEMSLAGDFANRAQVDYRIPNIEDIRTAIKAGSIVIANINAATLSENQGYSGHFVVVCDVSLQGVVIHDPGIPPRPNLSISTKTFQNAWGYPTDNEKNLMILFKKDRNICNNN